MISLKRSIFVIIAIAATTVFAIGQQRLQVPQVSQMASVMQRVGLTDISITYSRPAVKGRKVYGDWPTEVKGEATLDNQNARPKDAPLVPWGHVWRAGANEATMFIVADDVLINGQPLAAGKYSLHTIPTKDGEWTVIFNRDDGQWGSFSYDASKDALRVKTKAASTAESQEFLTYSFDNVADNSANVVLRWEKVAVPFKVEVKDVVGSTMKRLSAYVSEAKPDEFSRAYNAAMYAKSVKLNDDAARWFDQALKAADVAIAAKPTFVNYRAKSAILFNAGRSQEAIAATEKAIEVGKAEKADVSALEKRVADLKAAKQ